MVETAYTEYRVVQCNTVQKSRKYSAVHAYISINWTDGVSIDFMQG